MEVIPYNNGPLGLYGLNKEHMWFYSPKPWEPPSTTPLAAPQPPLMTQSLTGPGSTGGGSNATGYMGTGSPGLAGNSAAYGGRGLGLEGLTTSNMLGGIGAVGSLIPGPAGMAVGGLSSFAKAISEGVSPLEAVGRGLIGVLPLSRWINKAVFGLTPAQQAHKDAKKMDLLDDPFAYDEEEKVDEAAADAAAWSGYMGPGTIAGPTAHGGIRDNSGMQRGDAMRGAPSGAPLSSYTSNSPMDFGGWDVGGPATNIDTSNGAFDMGFTDVGLSGAIDTGSGAAWGSGVGPGGMQSGSFSEAGGAGGAGGGAGGGGSIICEALYKRGLVPHELYQKAEANVKYLKPRVLRGYYRWAPFVVKLVNASKVAAWLTAPLALPIIKGIARGGRGLPFYLWAKTCFMLGKKRERRVNKSPR